ncbi:DUF4279 domain-containing protein [Labrys monachus]|uniref:DUF4279 domain-containing protein n=1 Tax=Labrys monachus TaxID=217067 RepID=A0ABU0FAX2_9HYPH|nr:DUF4279 domain-containing protein [Labrys monachus]MDQ0391185.1 hypothetical protein [Labrys monachus]
MTSTPTSAGKDYRLAHASACVQGDNLDPDFWTAYFDCKPDKAIRKGLPFATPSGRIRLGATGLWSIQSRSHVRADELTPHISHLLHRLRLPRPALADLLKSRGERFRIFCYWDNDAGDRLPVVSEQCKRDIELSGGTIDIDEYPKTRDEGCDE